MRLARNNSIKVQKIRRDNLCVTIYHIVDIDNNLRLLQKVVKDIGVSKMENRKATEIGII